MMTYSPVFLPPPAVLLSSSIIVVYLLLLSYSNSVVTIELYGLHHNTVNPSNDTGNTAVRLYLAKKSSAPGCICTVAYKTTM
jgi:hypothetical protein